MALSAEEEDAFRAWMATQNDTPDDDQDDEDDDVELDDDDDAADDDEDDEDDDDPGVTLKAGGVLIYRGKTYQRVKETPKKRAPARKRTSSTGTPPRGKGATRPKVPAKKIPPKDPAPGGSGTRKLFT